MTDYTPCAMMDSKPSPEPELKPAPVVTERITVNVSGRRYETHDAVLRRQPQTLLGDLQRRAAFWDATRKEFFFDRCASSFEGILLAYQTGGEAWRPCGVPIGIFLEDLKFFGLTEQAARLTGESGTGGGGDRGGSAGGNDGGSGSGGDGNVSVPPAQSQPVSQTAGLRARLMTLLKQPLAIAASQLVTLVAVVAYAVSTLPSLQPQPKFPWSDDELVDEEASDAWLVVLLVLELLCMLVLFGEVVLRFLASGTNLSFFKDPMNVLELLMTVPFFLFFIVVLCTGIPELPFEYKGIYWIINLIRLPRLFRIFRVLREAKNAQTLGRAVAASAPAFGIISVIWMVAVTFFASLMYWAELTKPPVSSLPRGIYWAMITMTTVGYGDIFPKTKAGRFFGAICAYTGYVMLALPIAVFVRKLAQCSREDGRGEGEAQSTFRLWRADQPPEARDGGVETVAPTRV